MRPLVLALMLVGTSLTAAHAVNPDEILADPALEARAREISAGLRCMVCQNQSIDDSNAELARDLRVLVRERLTAGDSDRQVVDYVVSRYGEFVLLKPPFAMKTILLWVTPFLLLVAGSAFVFRQAARRSTIEGAAPLTAEEEKQLGEILGRDDSR